MKKLALRLVSFAAPLAFAATAFAQEGGDGDGTAIAGRALGAGLGMGIAAFGCGMGQGRAAAAALEGIARNPNASGKILVPLILGLALIESLAIYALVITYLIKP
jgi:F-type H+-transporting ATPase subunit c